MHKSIAPFIAVVTLTACGSPAPLSVDNDDFNRAVINNNAAATFPLTAPEDIANGAATYSGAFTSGARVNNESGFALIGDVEMRADFGSGGISDVSGRITDINLIDRNRTRDLSQRLDGQLRIDGQTGSGVVAADATGELTWVSAPDVGFRETADVNLRLEGDLRSSGLDVPGDIVHGTVTGGGDGGFDLDLTGDGRFTVGN